MTIRPAQLTDASATVRLLFNAIKDIGYQLTGGVTEQEVIERLTSFYEQKGNRFSYTNYLIKEMNEQAAGMILCYHGSQAETIDKPIIDQLRRMKNEPNLTIDKEADEDEYYIDALAVSPEWGGRGFGTELITAAEQHARQLGYKKIALNVEQYNERAVSLYKKLGYATDKETQINKKTYYHMIKSV
ncbi:GNAT family N-acetyltransferase [Paenibacillus radicis (ex Xue et al. 2023)]|uniref:GNAT family N-acetyltransferase n=1 Tax=Paenibacillus radicis (ex Xue et al. 2023) TaxID=2972489 RepID=A0ABT1YHJ1_9BACL|nr:GNAT family N-acetyltransferase [Paenibacillus radicis (ex Xue et al. 2023)]MCR8632651.1 GNAT family N-acetyltransferase [Paenibacillus radicis (ex Xue et al. 2023)]